DGRAVDATVMPGPGAFPCDAQWRFARVVHAYRCGGSAGMLRLDVLGGRSPASRFNPRGNPVGSPESARSLRHRHARPEPAMAAGAGPIECSPLSAVMARDDG